MVTRTMLILGVFSCILVKWGQFCFLALAQQWQNKEHQSSQLEKKAYICIIKVYSGNKLYG